jgi:transglutaminase-like putative cysteine protease
MTPQLTVRLGCELTYSTSLPVPALILVRPSSTVSQTIQEELLTCHPFQLAREDTDSHGNRVDRLTLQPGLTTIRHDALVQVTSAFEPELTTQPAIPIDLLPMALLRYTLPSRYCDSDRLMSFTRGRFDSYAPGAPTVRAICDWVHNNIEYRFGSGSPEITAAEIIARGYGVCRDFAHVAAALCRTFNIPARYVTSHLPDIAAQDSGTPMDFHANIEVYLDNRWFSLDARFNEPRIGRIKIAGGMDAAETAISTLYGNADLVSFYVWNYQVDPATETLRNPVDLSTRMDGTTQLNFTHASKG